jgi:inner membrane protein
MTWITHSAFAGLTSWVFGLDFGLAVLGSTAPDWFEDFFGVREHRGITHWLSLWFVLFVFFLALSVEGFGWAVYLLSFVYGGLSHVVLDALTVSGVPLGFSKVRVRIGGLVRTGKTSEWVFLALIVIFLSPLVRLDVKVGYSKWKELYEAGVIDRREYEERRFKIF